MNTMFKELTRFGSMITVFEYHPDQNPSQIIKADGKRTPLKEFSHSYYNRHGYKEIAKINLTTFHNADINSIHYGWLFWDSGHELNKPTPDMVECYLTKPGNKLVVADLKEKPKQDIWWGISLLFALVIDGKKNLLKSERFAHRNSSVERTMLGQKKDGTMVMAMAKSLTGSQAADLMLELGCVTSIMCDGGASAQLEVNGKHYGGSRPLGTVLAVMGDKEKTPKGDDQLSPKIMIDPGHGGADPGAVANGFGLREKDLTLTISKHINYFLLKDYEVDVRMTREIDKTMNLNERTDLANRIQVDYFVSVHINAGGGTGYEDYIFVKLNDSSQSTQMREIIHIEIRKILDKYNIRNRGMKKANFAVLRETNMPAVLTENLFIDHPEDQKLLKNEAFLKDISEAHASGIAKALGLSKKEKPELVNPIPPNKVGGQPGIHRVLVEGNQVGAWGEMSYLLRNIEKAIDSGAKEIKIEKV